MLRFSGATFISRWLIALVSCIFARAALAVPTEVLPSGVRSVSVRGGMIDGMDQTFTSEGRLAGLGATKSMSFDAKTLARVNERARELIAALNSIGSGHLGSKIHLGTLIVDTRPEMQYIAPVFAYGVSRRWTLALGLPVVHYTNQIALTANGSNLSSYRDAGLMGVSHELDQALTLDLVSEVEELLSVRGYKPLKNRNETFLADAQLAALYQIHASSEFRALYQATLSLPTGPAYDPDDLMAPNQFGRTSLESTLALAFLPHRKLTLAPYASLQAFLPDQIEARVPKSEDDALPAAEQKEIVLRRLGLTGHLGADVSWDFTSEWSSLVGVDWMQKAEDRYEGSRRSSRTDLLSKDTAAQAMTAKTGVSYSTIQKFKRKASAIPWIASLEVSDILMGVNQMRQTKFDLAMAVFF